LEATTGWRFVVEESRRVGASVHLAEPAQTSALRGNKKRAKNDRADARHLRELLTASRLPECWIPPDHILDLRARVRLRHALVHERGEWQQRIHSVLYHHGLPKRASLLTRENRAWVEQLALPAAGREQITVALAMIDAADVQLGPLDKGSARVCAPAGRVPRGTTSPMHRGRLPTVRCRHVRVDGLQRPSGRNALPPAGTTPHHRHVADPGAWSWTEISMGARAHNTPVAPARRVSSATRSTLRVALRVTQRRLLALDRNEWSGQARPTS
jgi:hypothetical protein